jgi:hypothetical protein
MDSVLRSIRLRALAAAFLALLGGACASAQHNRLSDAERDSGWVLLFDGRSLDGWTTSGNRDAWLVQDGELHTTGQGGWWLRTEKRYRDFELALDFNVPENGNSGVGLRGSATGDPAFTGMEVQIYDNHGDEPAVHTCGAVYNAIAPASTAVNPAGAWNTYRIRLVGDTLDVWLNGERIHEGQKLDDRGFFRSPDQPMPLNARLTTGYISIQDHGNPVRFRNIKVRDLSPDPDTGGFEPIFRGPEDLFGWEAKGNGTWNAAKDDAGAVNLTGRDGPTHLYSPERYTDVEVRAFVRVNTRGNSGIFVRSDPPPNNPASWPLGYEAQVDNHDPRNWTGCVYAKAHPDGDYQQTLLTRDNAWFDYRVRVEGTRIRTWVNGVAMVDAELDEFEEGHIALQGHHPGNVVDYREIEVRIPGGASREVPGEDEAVVR